MRAYRAAPWVAAGVVALLGCSSKSPAASGSPSITGDDSDAASTPTGPTNPDGFSYPKGPYGKAARVLNTVGSRIANFSFLGYPAGDTSGVEKTISLIDFYDPCGKRLKLIHLSVAAVWCVPCNQETKAMVMAQSSLDADQIVVLQALDDGPTMGTGATKADLDGWINMYHPAFTEMLDPGLNNLGGFFDAAAIPWNADIDPRTMEILDSSTGWDSNIPVATELSPALAAVNAAPGYPLAVSCN